jgi:hypothetical protein
VGVVVAGLAGVLVVAGLAVVLVVVLPVAALAIAAPPPTSPPVTARVASSGLSRYMGFTSFGLELTPSTIAAGALKLV